MVDGRLEGILGGKATASQARKKKQGSTSLPASHRMEGEGVGKREHLETGRTRTRGPHLVPPDAPCFGSVRRGSASVVGTRYLRGRKRTPSPYPPSSRGQKYSTLAGFEPTPTKWNAYRFRNSTYPEEEHIDGIRVHRLNHLAIVP